MSIHSHLLFWTCEFNSLHEMRLDSQFLHHFMCFYLFLIFLISSWNASLLFEYSILHAALCVWAQSLFGLVPSFVPPRSQISPGHLLSCPWSSSEWSLRSNYQITPRVTAYQDSLLFSNHNLKFCSVCIFFYLLLLKCIMFIVTT